MKRFLVVFVVLIVLLLGGAVIGPSFVDWNKYKTQIVTQLKEATGHDYKIDGTIDLAFLPYPHVSIGKLSVVTPSTSGDLPLLQLEKASVQLALMPLFSGEIIVSKVLLQKPVFELAIGGKGQQSWMTPLLTQKMGQKQDGGGLPPELVNAVALNEISIRDGSFAFTDYRTGQKIALDDINITLQGDSLFGPYALEGDLVYDTHKAKVKLKTGRIDKMSESISAQLNLSFPDLGSTISYSGILARDNKKIGLQGETGIETPDVAALMAVVSKNPVHEYLKKPLSTKGILTFNSEEIAYRNLRFGFAGVDGTGYVVLKNFQKDAKGPLDVNLVVETTKPYQLEKFLMASKEGTKTGAGLLPQTFTLPREITGAFNVKSAAVEFGGTTYNNVAFSFDSKEKGFGGQINLSAPGNTAIDINSTLNFGAQSLTPQTGAMTYSDPELILETKLVSEEPHNLLSNYSKAPLSPGVINLLSQKLGTEARLAVGSRTIAISDSYVKLGDTRFNGNGTFVKGTGGSRDLLKVTLSNIGLEADPWLAKLKTQNAAPTASKPDITAFTKNIALPFDVEFTAEIQGLRVQGQNFTKFATKGKLLESHLSLDALELASNAGDTFLVAGAIKDITALRGIDMSFQADIVDPPVTLQAFGVDAARLPTSIGKAEILTEIKGQPEKLAFTTNLKAMRASLQASGEIADALTAAKVSDLTLRLQHPSYVEMARIFNPKFNSGVAIKKSLDIFASMSRKDNVYSFSQLQAIIGPASIKGDVIADVSGAKPAITAALEFTDLPVDDLFGIRTGGKSGTIKAQPLKKNQDVRWSRNAINTALLHVADIELKATANKITYGNWVFNNAGLNLDLKDGNLAIKQLDGGLYGGAVAITGNLKSSKIEREPLSFDGKILAQDVNLEQFVGSFSGSQLVKARGAVSLETDLQTTGLSPAALVFDLKGKGNASGQNIVLEGFDLARLSRALAEPSSSFTENFTRLLDASMGGGSTQFDTLDSIYTITEGVINFDKLDLAGPSADVVTRGTVSLPLWSMDLESTVQLKEPEDAPPLKASFKGPIDKPTQTFGQNAMQQYFQRQIEGTIISPLIDEIDDTGVLKNLLGLPGQKQAPAPQPAPEQQPQQQIQPQPEQQTQQQQAPQRQQREITPEEAIFGVIEGVLGGG